MAWVVPLTTRFLLLLTALAGAGWIVHHAALPGGFEWGFPWAFAALIPVMGLPFQPLVSGANRLAVPGGGRRKWTVRLALAGAPDLLRLVGLVLLVVALARPRLTHRDVVTESQGLDILIALDTSGSMRQADMPTGTGLASRIDVAKGVAAEFVEGRPHDRVGLVVFGEEAFTYVPLTLDHDTLVEVLETVQIGMAGSRGTAVGTALAVSAKRMKKLEAPERIVILITDGRSNAGRLSPIEAAQAAAALGMRVYTIGVGAAPGALDVLMGDGVDEPMMKEVAEATGGQYFRATSMRGLQAVYSRIDELEKSPAKVKEFVEHEELYRRVLVPGAASLVFGILLGSTVFRRAP